MATDSEENDVFTPFTEKQLALLKRPLPPSLVSERQGGGGTMLKHLEGHNAIDQANRIFGWGNWNYHTLSCEQVVIKDPITGEALGITYQATVKLDVRGCEPIIDVGSQPVAIASVEDWMTNFYTNASKYGNKVDESEQAQRERLKKARTAVMDAHEMAHKGAVTDAVKRCLRAYGRQFGNDLYGKPKTVGQVKTAVMKAGKAKTWRSYVVATLGEDIKDEDLTQDHLQILLDGIDKSTIVEQSSLSANEWSTQSSSNASTNGNGAPHDENAEASVTEQQIASICKLCQHLGKSEPDNIKSISFLAAKRLIQQLTAEYKSSRQNTSPQNQPADVPTPPDPPAQANDPASITAFIAQVMGYGKENGIINTMAEWKQLKFDVFHKQVADKEMTRANVLSVREEIIKRIVARSRQEPQVAH
jgi:hypothetical protein